MKTFKTSKVIEVCKSNWAKTKREWSSENFNELVLSIHTICYKKVMNDELFLQLKCGESGAVRE